ncbi:f5ef4ff7-a19a-4b9d-ae77-8f9841909a73 [Thermothielavioides terrestris]|uniref:Uncharacterized protein n=2 Tax=Thermothielavioides terrestris TaxID=2587410 RepID=G2QZN2_THETT|nr:uncharacterized protein THITE_2114413 [Thermothielavioides terrestris NRRL 8126]AEO66361.1 hypothetical protein THITE_2114413 [Thermothielavioides terrestris NRRL 8126]SPQ25472.1 f5ef4ff7-a19a-4b9d-ae77-8f9841909a73 [Thermothielavioides terrestris]
MDPSSKAHPQDSHVGPRSNSGKAGAVQTPANAHLGQDKPGMFDAQGSIGKQFTPEGALGGTAQKIGGPLDKEGMIGKQFTTEGSIGGTVQNTMGGKSKTSN